jgi:hypothetical protein
LIRWFAVVALLGFAMLTNDSYRERAIMRKVSDRVEGADRFVDASVVLHVLSAKPTPGAPTVTIGGRVLWDIRQHPRGGIIDTKASPPRIVGFSQSPVHWQCSEDQERIILHGDSEPVGKLALGGMGAGKTTAGVVWAFWRWTELIGSNKEAGITAPTETRLSAVFNEMFSRFSPSWWKYNSETKVMTMCDGFRWRGVSTHRQSALQGSRVQQFNWVALFMDELQDQVDEFVNAQARLRSKEDGRAKRIATATAKDMPEWRNLKDGVIGSGLWQLHTMLGPNSPFIHPDHWDAMRRVTTDRDYRRLVLAEDLPPESRVYFGWDRKENLRPTPAARKITSVVLSRKTGNPRHALLIGHDPGTAKAASIFLDAYDIRGEVCWWVRAELFTLHKSSEQHALEALEVARKRFGVNVREEIAHVRAQPVGQAEDRPDLDIYRIWKRVGFDIKAAQYKKDGTGTGQIKKDSRIEMVNRLLCDAAGRRRLFVDIDDQGKPVAPKLVEAFETMERDHRGRAEHEEKDEKDPTDSPCALGYALWFCEKESATALRADIRKGIG